MTTKTLIAVLASHDSIIKNNELARVFERLHDTNHELLGKFHFVFTGGTFRRLMLRKDDRVAPDADKCEYPPKLEDQAKYIYPIRDDVRNFLLNPDKEGPNVTVLPDQKRGV
ncbi:MAG: hypothetical protein QMD80_04400 [archaeon]|nr:hypothetical protein [archaeon]